MLAGIFQCVDANACDHLIHQPITVSMCWFDSFYFSMWTRFPVNRIQSRNNWNSWASNRSSDSSQYVVVSFLLLQCVETLCVNRIQSGNKWNCWSLDSSSDSCQYVVVLFFLFQCVDAVVCEQDLIKKQLELLCTWSSSDSCQYVVVLFFLFQCVDSVACEHNSIKKQLELLSIKSSKRYLSVCGGLNLFPSVCGSICLWTQFN